MTIFETFTISNVLIDGTSYKTVMNKDAVNRVESSYWDLTKREIVKRDYEHLYNYLKKYHPEIPIADLNIHYSTVSYRYRCGYDKNLAGYIDIVDDFMNDAKTLTTLPFDVTVLPNDTSRYTKDVSNGEIIEDFSNRLLKNIDKSKLEIAPT